MPTTESSTLIASAVGVGSIGGAFFGVAGAVVGLLVGFGLGYWSENENRRMASHNKLRHKHNA